ncbi:hypothetical protein [Streptomyces cinerochromogenes]|uniref:hypothetical protein n=1 Tax=Streptomyces cinerochromogenes TaxID=66422 RepID=UPI0016712740|nr:hypothetical protein [Streptomyces cinerochromogenes]GGS55397.1 hypothetical protein GCM10010206_16530 [Streptomyces cinerochromogenes]
MEHTAYAQDVKKPVAAPAARQPGGGRAAELADRELAVASGNASEDAGDIAPRCRAPARTSGRASRCLPTRPTPPHGQAMPVTCLAVDARCGHHAGPLRR